MLAGLWHKFHLNLPHIFYWLLSEIKIKRIHLGIILENTCVFCSRIKASLEGSNIIGTQSGNTSLRLQLLRWSSRASPTHRSSIFAGKPVASQIHRKGAHLPHLHGATLFCSQPSFLLPQDSTALPRPSAPCILFEQTFLQMSEYSTINPLELRLWGLCVCSCQAL